MAEYKTYNFPTLISGSFYRGTRLTFYSDLEETIPIDLTGVVVKMEMKLKYTTATVKIFSTADGSILISDPTNGVVDFVGVNMDIPDGHYLLDVDFTFPSGENKVFIKGTWVIEPKVTTRG